MWAKGWESLTVSHLFGLPVISCFSCATFFYTFNEMIPPPYSLVFAALCFFFHAQRKRENL
ncbi:hypothetical protein BJ875DRAFT_244592 [Amylocarpus encephaloides]|uniref:Uncharacterized protein n=1 Tax=Amylocarpus encephaloides TaxID=45428 RepID=A0A9P8C9S7_9HELO|nr:hypothetical protein BJ875DRAFT_244592 [Amylocarpus encephaloides]